MKRRTLMLALGGSLTTPQALGQTPTAPRRLAVLTVSNAAAFAGSLQGLRDGLRERGHVEGRDVVIDIRNAGGRVRNCQAWQPNSRR